MEILLKMWRSTLYSWPAALFTTLFFIILFFIPAKKPSYIPLTIKLYLVAYSITFIVVDLSVLIRNKYDYFTNTLRNYGDYLFTITEFILITYYFYSHNKHPQQRRWLVYNTTLFLAIAITLAFQLPKEYAVVRLYTTQVFLLLIPAFFYFRNLFKIAVPDISNEPSFWISTGIAFFLLCTITLSIIETFFLSHKPLILAKLYPIYHLSYILMFFMFFRAYLCKPSVNNS